MPAASQIEIKRKDGSTITATLITHGPRGREKVTPRVYEAVVGPGGDVIPAPVNTELDKPGLRFVELVHDEVVLTRHAKRLGYTFYRDMCLYGIPEEDVEPSPEHWYLYQALLELKAKNQLPVNMPSDEVKWHPEVLRRREANASGVQRVSDERLQETIDRIRAQSDNSPEAIASAKAKGLRVPEQSSSSVQELVKKIEEKKGKARG